MKNTTEVTMKKTMKLLKTVIWVLATYFVCITAGLVLVKYNMFNFLGFLIFCFCIGQFFKGLFKVNFERS